MSPRRPINLNKKPTPPMTPAAAIQNLIRISQSLIMIAEKETKALLVSDILAFSIMQYEKEKLAEQYTAASTAFRSQIEVFRHADRNLLDRLEKLQKDLSIKSADNNALVERMRQRVEATAPKNIVSAHELGKTRRVRFDNELKSTTEGAQP